MLRWLLPLAAAAGTLPFAAWARDPGSVRTVPGSDVTGVLATLQQAAQDATLFVDGIGAWTMPAMYGLLAAGALVATVLCFALVARAWHRIEARSLAAACALLTWFVGAFFIALPYGSEWPVLSPLFGSAAARHIIGGAALASFGAGCALLVRFAANFPIRFGSAQLDALEGDYSARLERLRVGAGRPGITGTLARLRARAAYGGAGFDRQIRRMRAGRERALQLILSPRLPWYSAALGAGAYAFDAAFAMLASYLFLLYAVMLTVVIPWVMLRTHYRSADAHVRERVLWVAAGFLAAAWAAGLLVYPGMLIAVFYADELGAALMLAALPLVAPLMGLLVLLALAGALFYRGDLDPGLVIRRTTLYGATGVMLVFVFAGIESVLASALERWLPALHGLSKWLATGGAALMLGPLRTAIGWHLPRESTAAPATAAGRKGGGGSNAMRNQRVSG